VTAALPSTNTAALATLPSTPGDVTRRPAFGPSGTTRLEGIPSAREHACTEVVNDLSALKEARTRVRFGEAYPPGRLRNRLRRTSRTSYPRRPLPLAGRDGRHHESGVAWHRGGMRGVHPAARIAPMPGRGRFLASAPSADEVGMEFVVGGVLLSSFLDRACARNRQRSVSPSRELSRPGRYPSLMPRRWLDMRTSRWAGPHHGR
jgi:hypothetical protein